MNKFTFQIGLFFFSLLPQLCSGLELSLRPRFNTGFQFFEYNQDEVILNTGTMSQQFSEIKFNDFTPFVSGGLTLFVDRFFIDSTVQYSFEGQDTINASNNTSVPAMGPLPDTVIHSNGKTHLNFDRLEYSFSLGYAITDQIVVYAGYKNARTEIDGLIMNRTHAVSANNSVPNPFLTGTATGRLSLNSEYDGAFVGGSYSQNIDIGFLHGALSANVAVAFMEGEVDLEFRDIRINNQFDGSISLQVDTPNNLKGDTVGVSAGLAWNGLTAISGLTYLIGVNGYHYEFDGIDDSPSFSETVVRVDFGLSYTF